MRAMKIRTKFEIFDTWTIAEAKCKNKNAFICELSNGKTIAIYFSSLLKEYLDRIGNSSKNIKKTHESLMKALKLGQVSGVFDFYIDCKGAEYLCR